MYDPPDHSDSDSDSLSDPSLESLHAQIAELIQRFDSLAHRVEALEHVAAGQATTGPIQEPSAELSAKTFAEPRPTTETPEAPPIGDTPSQPRTLERLQAKASASTQSSVSEPTPLLRSTESTPPKRPRIKPRPYLRFDLKNVEWLLGVWGLALAGVVVVVVGVGMFLKYAYDEGLVTAIPPVWRCLSAALFGGALVGIGEVLRRKINPPASSGVSAAGIAIVYAAALAATKLYDILPVAGTFALLAERGAIPHAANSLSVLPAGVVPETP